MAWAGLAIYEARYYRVANFGVTLVDVLTSSKTHTKADDLVKMRQDPAFFDYVCLRNHFEMPMAEIHVDMIRAFFSPNPFVNIIVPRKFGKTTTIQVGGILYSICFKTEGYILTASETVTEARSNMRTVKYELSTNEVIEFYFGKLRADKVRDNEGKWSQDIARTNNGVWIVSKGCLSQVRGIKAINIPPTLIVGDDLQSQRSVLTYDALEKADNWWENEVVFARAQKWKDARGKWQHGKVRCMGTVVHQDCIVQRKRKDQRYENIFMQAIRSPGVDVHTAFPTANDYPERRSLWPEMFPLEFLDKEYTDYNTNGKGRNWMQERMNVAMSRDDRPFDVKDVKFWSDNDAHFDRVNDVNVLVFNEELAGVTDELGKI